MHNLSSPHDWHQEHASDQFKDQVDEGQEESDGADVLEGFPRVGVLEGFAGPDVAHHEDPQHVHNDSHCRQQKQLKSKQNQ